MEENDKTWLTFIGENVSFTDSEAVILPVPYEGTVSYSKGTSLGPESILSASWQVEPFDSELKEDILKKVGIHTLKSLDVKKRDPEKVIAMVYEETKKILSAGKFPVIIGGEHSITSGSAKAAKEHINDITVIQIDAHADLRDEYGGSKYSHACVMRRINEMGIKTVQVGIRSYSKEEHEYISANSLCVFEAPFSKEQINEILDNCSEEVYLTIDADGFDPSIVPAVGTPVPGGLKWEESLELFRQIFSRKNVIGLDFVELSKAESTRSADLAATLIYRLIGYKFLK